MPHRTMNRVAASAALAALSLGCAERVIKQCPDVDYLCSEWCLYIKECDDNRYRAAGRQDGCVATCAESKYWYDDRCEEAYASALECLMDVTCDEFQLRSDFSILPEEKVCFVETYTHRRECWIRGEAPLYP